MGRLGSASASSSCSPRSIHVRRWKESEQLRKRPPLEATLVSPFEYLSVFVAVVLGLAATRVLSALGSSLRHRESISSGWMHSLWALNMLIYVVSLWWTSFAWNQLSEWNYVLFLFIVLYTIVLYLLTDVLYPDQVTAGLDLRSHFMKHRSVFFGLLMFAVLLDIGDMMLKERLLSQTIPVTYWVSQGIWLIIPPIGLLRSGHRVHSALPVIFFLSMAGWLVLERLLLLR